MYEIAQEKLHLEQQITGNEGKQYVQVQVTLVAKILTRFIFVHRK